MELSQLPTILQSPKTIGRKEKAIEVLSIRPLIGEDLDKFLEEQGTKPVPIKALRQKHHALARALASGMDDNKAGLITGYNASYVSILKSDPTFKNLVYLYQKEQDDIFADMNQKLANVSMDALSELSDRLEDTPDDFSVAQLMDIVVKTADRSGNGPQTSQTVNVNFGIADRLQAARERSILADCEVIDITPNESLEDE